MLKITSTSKHHPMHSRRRQVKLPLGTQRFLAAFEGIEGGFAVGASIVVALGLAGMQRELLLATAVISIIVSGFNSSSVKYSSEHYLDELDGREKKDGFKHYFVPSLIEFICYAILSLITVLPLILLTDVGLAVSLSVVLTIVMLFLAGFWRGYMLRTGRLRDGLETAALGLGMVTVGLVSGLVVNSL
jgi:VIT1/CCC1 family predicted Fe2+/Mn2+ transporter